MKTVHLIFNAHLDPIWLWPWQAGVDEALATCRSACDRLDAHPDLMFSRGEAWVYQQIERLDAELFQRITRHIMAGRWEIVGGWWIQPDCNLPSGFGFQRQIEIGKRYFQGHFGRFPRVAYNVDSFGHAATLPGLMRQAGQDCYVMMRPGEHEMHLPARMFRWRGFEGGEEVTVFRIAGAYCTGEIREEHVRAALEGLSEGVNDTMCFVGLGDHGGGPTERQIAWCREHQDAFDGARLVFSTPSRFFGAIDGQRAKFPLVTGELQHHAIGCYSVHRPVKLLVRQAEHLLARAELALADDAALESQNRTRVDEAWERVCFHQFHDTMGGTCLPSAYEQVHAQLQGSIAVADEVLQHALRRKLPALGDDRLQRAVVRNVSDAPFDGYVAIEPWVQWSKWQERWRVLDEEGRALPYQVVHAEAVVGGMARLLLRLKIDAGKMRVLRLDTQASGEPAASPEPVKASALSLANAQRAALRLDGEGAMSVGGQTLALPQLHLIEDPSDTWSHGIDRYGESPVALAKWNAPEVLESGPLMASIVQKGTIGLSRLLADWRVYAQENYIELRLEIDWLEKHKLLKLVCPMPMQAKRRWDGIPGGQLDRPMDGKERPLRDRTLIELAGAQRVGIVCPAIFALDATPDRVRLTLLRSAIMAHHDPDPGTWQRGVVSDQGHHTFPLRFYAGKIDGQALDEQALMLQRPPITADLTRGMPTDRFG